MRFHRSPEGGPWVRLLPNRRLLRGSDPGGGACGDPGAAGGAGGGACGGEAERAGGEAERAGGEAERAGGRRVRPVAAVFILVAAVAFGSDAASADHPATTLTGSGFATPVDQTGARASVRGSLGEAWVGTIQGGAARIVTGIRPRYPAGPALSLVLLAPNGGEVVGTGNEVAVRWELTGSEPVVVDLDWSLNQGETWSEVAHGLVQEEEGTGTYTWTTPREGVAAALVRVRATGPAASLLDESDAPFTITDDDAPLLTLGLLANPYVGRFVDLVAVADEPVAAEGLRFEIDGEPRTPTGVGDAGRVFWLDTVVDGAVDSLAVRACAVDLAGNEGCADGALALVHLADGPDGHAPASPTNGDGASASPSFTGAPSGYPVAWSPDRRLGVAFHAVSGPRRAPRSVAILVTSPGPTTYGVGRDGVSPTRYEFLTEDTGPARLLVPLSAEDAGPQGPRFALHGPGGPVELWIDREAGLAHASLSPLTPLLWVPGGAGPFRDVRELRTEIRSVAPNPIVTRALVSFDLPVRSPVTLTVHDVTGRCVAQLLDGVELAPGRHEVSWNGDRHAEGGSGVPAGVYWLRLRAKGGESQARIVLLRPGGSR